MRKITQKDLHIPYAYSAFLENIQTSPRPAEMVIYDWTSLPDNIQSQFFDILKPCTFCIEQKTPISVKYLRFEEMKEANRVMDEIDRLHLNIDADISFLSK